MRTSEDRRLGRTYQEDVDEEVCAESSFKKDADWGQDDRETGGK